MSPWLVIPVKSLRDGKTRLSSVLDPVKRRAFMDRLLVRTLNQAATFPGLDRTLIVSACDETRARAIALGAHSLDESGCGLNAALKLAHASIRQQDATQLIVVPCDLPFLRAEDLQHLSQLATSGNIVIAPDRRMRGTNGLCFDATLEFSFEFGPDSYARHKNNARRLQRDYASAERPGLAFDVDTPDDLAELQKRDAYHPAIEPVSAH
jgi:2-phospho-L-lactate guanylyltransferase